MTSSPQGTVVITGCGWVTPLAAGTINDVLAAARRADGAVPADSAYWEVPDEVVTSHPGLAKELQRDKGAGITAVALEHACKQAGLVPNELDGERVGLFLGCALAGQLGMIDFANEVRQQTARFVSPIHFPQTVGNYVCGALARAYNIRGPNATLAAGASSGLDAILEARSALTEGAADVVFAGGSERLSEELARGLGADGVKWSEGACLFVLERSDRAADRGATPLASLFDPGDDLIRAGTAQAPGEALLSLAGTPLPGAIMIEHWVGRCCGAAGAAALAAAIGATDGGDLPIAQADHPHKIERRPIDLETPPAAEGNLRAEILADADGAHQSAVQLRVPVA